MLKEYIESIKDKSVSVIGIGVSNTPLIRLLAENGVKVTAFDKKSREQLGALASDLENLGVKLTLGPDYLSEVTGDIIFRTPGLRPDVPALLRARERGAVITSAMEVCLSLCPCMTIGVTGSDGKTTTTTIISELLKKSGRRVFTGGNIGTPLLDRTDEMTASDVCVLELSSFQLLTMNKSTDISVLTNLAPNHLDVHKDMDEYIRAKENIFVHGGEGSLLAANMDNDIAFLCSRKAPGGLRYFSRRYKRAFAFCDQKGGIFLNGGFLMNARDIRLPGVHNIENYMAAFCALYGLVSPEDMVQVAKEFGGVEHRLELVRTLNDVKY